MLSLTGEQDKNWERKQARSAMSDKLRKNEEAKGGGRRSCTRAFDDASAGSWLASVLPKLDFVEVYGQEKPEKESKEGGADKKEEEEMKDKQDSMMKAVERQAMNSSSSSSSTFVYFIDWLIYRTSNKCKSSRRS